MDVLKIDWTQTNYERMNDYNDTYFYAFTRGGNLLYIGIAFKQIVQTEISQTLRRLGINSKGLNIWLGYPNPDQTTYGRITEQIATDAECLMIYTNQPVYNTQCKDSYTGRCNFKVKTSGCPLIRSCVKCENNRIYVTCR